MYCYVKKIDHFFKSTFLAASLSIAASNSFAAINDDTVEMTCSEPNMELDQSSVPWYSTKTYTKDGVPLSFQFTIEIEFNGQDMREDCENISLQAHAMASLGFASNILKIPYVELPQKASEILRVSLNEAENKLNQEFGHTGDVRFVQFGVKNVIAVGLNARESNLMLLGGEMAAAEEAERAIEIETFDGDFFEIPYEIFYQINPQAYNRFGPDGGAIDNAVRHVIERALKEEYRKRPTNCVTNDVSFITETAFIEISRQLNSQNIAYIFDLKLQEPKKIQEKDVGVTESNEQAMCLSQVLVFE